MKNLWDHIENITYSGIDDYGAVWYLGALLTTALTIDAILSIMPFMIPIMMSNGGEFFIDLLSLVAGFFLFYGTETWISDTHILGIIIIVELVISFLLMHLEIFEEAFNMACIMSIISIIYWLVDRESLE